MRMLSSSRIPIALIRKINCAAVQGSPFGPRNLTRSFLQLAVKTIEMNTVRRFFRQIRLLKETKCRCMTLDEITKGDKELLASGYEAAITEEFPALAEFLDTTIEAMIARSRAASRVIGQMHEIAPEYDFEMELLDLIRRDGGIALSTVLK
jgi:hypothetical protein